MGTTVEKPDYHANGVRVDKPREATEGHLTLDGTDINYATDGGIAPRTSSLPDAAKEFIISQKENFARGINDLQMKFDCTLYIRHYTEDNQPRSVIDIRYNG